MNSRRLPVGRAVAAVMLSYLLVALATFSPGLRLWGIDHLAFYPLWLRAAALIAVFVSFVPAVARGIYGVALATARGLDQASTRRFGMAVCLAVITSIGLFYGFRSATNLLGDGRLIAHSFELAAQGDPSVVMHDARTIVTHDRISPGTTLLYHAAVKSLRAFGVSPVDAIRVVNCLLGGLFVGVLLTFVRRVPLDGHARAWILGLGLFSASLQLFFGYVENYATLQLLLTLYGIAAFLNLRGAVRIGWPIGVFVLAVIAHVQALVFGPSLLWLILWRSSRGRSSFVLKVVPSILLAIVLLATLLARFTFLSEYLLPFLQLGDYGVLAWRHLTDVVNLLLLLLPILPLVIVLRMPRLPAEAESGQTGGGPGVETVLGRPEQAFVDILLAANLVYLVFVNPQLGMAQDWDRFAMAALPLGASFVLALSRWIRVYAPDQDVIARFSGPALCLVMVMAVAWFGIQASPERTLARLHHMLEIDERARPHIYENLAGYYRDHDEPARATEMIERAYASSKNPRLAVQAAESFERMGRLDEAIALLRPIVTRRPELHDLRFMLVQQLARAGRWEEVVSLSQEGARFHPNQAAYLYFMGQGLLEMGRTEEAVEAFRRCRSMELPPGARQYIERVLAQHGSGE